MRSAPELPSMDVDLALETTFVHAPQPSPAPPSREPHTPTQLPRSKRQPFLPTTNANIENVPRGANGSGGGGSNGVQPLSIKKKTSVRSSTAGTPTPIRRVNVRHSPLARTGSRTTPPQRRVSPQVRTRTHGSMRSSPAKGDAAERMAQGLQSSRDAVSPFHNTHFVVCLLGGRSLTIGLQVASSRRAVKRIKLEIDDFRMNLARGGEIEFRRAPSPDKSTRTPQKVQASAVRAQPRRDWDSRD